MVKKPENKNIIDSKWVFSIKTDEFGNPVRYKARLVARGFSQQYQVDYFETFAPVARISTFRIILALANQFNLLIHHMDVKTAFLNGTLREEIYMKIPEGIACNKNNVVCKLNKTLYGLKQAARYWFKTFEKALLEAGFQNSPVDRCMYILNKGHISRNIYVVLYVDDLVIATADINKMNNFKNYLMKKFSMVDLKEIKYFLGIKIERNIDKITLDQSAYIKNVLLKYRMSECNSINTPLETKLNYEGLNSDENCGKPCQNLIGSLMYIMLCTRPDICASVSILSRFANKNNITLWEYLRRILKYLKGTIELKLVYKKESPKDVLIGFVDADWGSDETDRKSTTGYLFMLFNKCVICWNTKKQHCVADSSCASEYMALYEGVKEALFLKSLLNSINIKIRNPITIFEDNDGCICIAENPTSHKRSKHIDIKYHFSREQVEKKVIKLEKIATKDQLADLFTKSLPQADFIRLRNKLNLE